jgi:hypothetical protein
MSGAADLLKSVAVGVSSGSWVVLMLVRIRACHWLDALDGGRHLSVLRLPNYSVKKTLFPLYLSFGRLVRPEPVEFALLLLTSSLSNAP